MLAYCHVAESCCSHDLCPCVVLVTHGHEHVMLVFISLLLLSSLVYLHLHSPRIKRKLIICDLDLSLEESSRFEIGMCLASIHPDSNCIVLQWMLLRLNSKVHFASVPRRSPR